MRGSSEPVRINMVETCYHAANSAQYSRKEIEQLRDLGRCADCNFRGKNLWLCLGKECKRVMCSDTKYDHSQTHYTSMPSHTVQLNLHSQRLWCYNCSKETVFPPLGDQWRDDDGTGDAEDGFIEMGIPKGLQNIGNTCYMNSALQALCNIPPLREHFTQTYFPTMNEDKKHCLSRNFQRLIEDMCERGGPSYLVPNGILYGIRSVHPMFRGYQQHDTQEFLRCFMDQLHDELKDPVAEAPPRLSSKIPVHNMMGYMQEEADDEEDGRGDQAENGASSGSQSEAEYETCDSGVSERSSLSDEGERASIKRKHSLSSSPPARSKMPLRPLSFRGPASPGKQKRRPVKYRSIISELFDGKLLSSVECLYCNKVSTRVETFQDLSLPIPSRDHVTMLHQGSLSPQAMATCSDVYKGGKPTWVSWLWEWVKSWFWGPTVSLHDCLAAFFSADDLKGDNMYSCEKCSMLRNGLKFSKVLELPEVLCVHLKRFRHELAFSSKISNFVSFPLTDLDMRPYLHKECKSEVTSYDLSSVICHHGTAGGGHYTCYAINPNTGQWYELDDQCVTPVPAETVTNVEGYVLFYRKNNEKAQKIWRKAFEMMVNRNAEPTLMEFYVSHRWMNRLKTFAEPGPIDNSDFLCPHGGVHPSKVAIVEKLTEVLSAEVWEFLYNEFKGGPACNRLYKCPICEDERVVMRNRTKFELSQYLSFKHDFKNDENPPVIYGLAMSWFRQWETFVQGATDPPGPIDNSSIVVVVNGQKVLKAGSDYGQVSQDLYSFFWNIYGGGPELVIKQLTRGPSRASFSSGISLERERERISVSASKAKSVESLPVNIGAGDVAPPKEIRAGRTHSVSSDNVNIKMAAASAFHRKQQSLDNVRLERVMRLEDEKQSKTTEENQRKEEQIESDENAYCPAFTPDELDYVPFKK